MSNKYLIKKLVKNSDICMDEGEIIKCAVSKNAAIKRARKIVYQQAREYRNEGYEVIVETKKGCSCLYGDIITFQVTRKSENLYNLDYYYIERLK